MQPDTIYKEVEERHLWGNENNTQIPPNQHGWEQPNRGSEMADCGRVDNQNPPQAFRGRPYPGEIRRLKDAEDPEMTLPAMLNAGTSGVELNSGKRHQQEMGIN